MPKQIITTSSAPTTGFTPGKAVSPLAQAIRFGNMLFAWRKALWILQQGMSLRATSSCRRARRSTIL